MQLFTFGHPCEHQLRRACIGGAGCPLNGYPDHWCCSYVKGRINFKRDKPCEGARCRWGFAHPPATSFEAVTLALHEGRACAAKIEEHYGAGPIHGGPFTITSPHVADVAHCALNYLRVPAARVAPRVGGLLAFAALKAGDAKVFTQLLKTVKKPVDDYLIGAYEFLQAVSKGSPAAGNTTANTMPIAGGKNAPAPSKDVAEDLRNDIVTIMASALSHGGALIYRAEQLPLQTYFLAALKGAPSRNKKRHVELLEEATALFPQAVEMDAPVAPDSWQRAGRRDSTSSGGGSEVDPNSTTPEHKPISPAVTPAKAPIRAADDTSSKPSTEPSPCTSPGLVSGPPLTAGDSARGLNAKAPEYPPLFSAAEALGFEGFPAHDTPAFWSVRYPQPEPELRVFGGLFSLDMASVRDVTLYPITASAVSSPDTLSVVNKTDKQAPLGAAIREAHARLAKQDRADPRSAEEIAAERRADLEAAAAALAAADSVLE